ncbi:hypothetical protein [Heyndrickxia camelliae]|uniref:Uncharacterized protein n=1 Tax=Heyndrickxia camelliae TaxID=1707093 RepID=A0A2N3LE90_9BACI|nr:hypothetical protein [Heyndrickxia camelliae]PKR82895.1 hypothetical protein CWO92_22150 [Heyndrickxia camelliae]
MKTKTVTIKEAEEILGMDINMSYNKDCVNYGLVLVNESKNNEIVDGRLWLEQGVFNPESTLTIVYAENDDEVIRLLSRSR